MQRTAGQRPLGGAQRWWLGRPLCWMGVLMVLTMTSVGAEFKLGVDVMLEHYTTC
jgi:hypothetical protein